MTPKDPPKDDRDKQTQAREARLAKALRENLKRRKAPRAPPSRGE